MSHYEFHKLQLPKWAHFAEDGHTVILKANQTYRRSDAGDWRDDNGDATLEVVVGRWLVETARQSRGLFASLQLSADASFGVEDIDGRFGWPPYEERGQDDKLTRAERPD